MVKILSECEDFRNEQPVIVKKVTDAEHHILFLPKFHCELNPIERVWCQTKAEVRKICDYSYPSLKANVEKCLNEVTIEDIRKFARHCRDYLRAYDEGIDNEGLLQKRKEYKSHRSLFVTPNL
eukprot:Pompholyxophrys_punicea_v1_NODE_259_length_2504_cov_17.915067.p1 type:complete len:123 gc:universal NODE_259_length_2504_cov_17.915067:1158-1526(+)